MDNVLVVIDHLEGVKGVLPRTLPRVIRHGLNLMVREIPIHAVP